MPLALNAYQAALVDDDGSNTTGSVWDKSDIATIADAYLGAGVASEVTIATGAATVTRNKHSVDTEADAASDDLDNITSGTDVVDGHLLILKPENAARVVTVKHGTGNILLKSGDFAMNDANHRLLLVRDGTNWLELARNTGGTSGVSGTGLASIEIKEKGTTETVTSSTTLQDDDTLTFSLAANKVAYVIGVLFLFGASGGDWKGNFKISAAGGGGDAGWFGPQTGTTDASNTQVAFLSKSVSTTTDPAAIGLDGSTQIPVLMLARIAAGANAQTVTLQWAQNTSSGTGTELRAPSFLVILRS